MTSSMDERSIRIFGARTNNLKDLSLSIPREQLVVITGRSGAGKSSLALGTIYAEGQRQYVESLSLHARQFFSNIPKAEVDLIEGLQPTLCLDQNRRAANRRSTVGTLTEIYDFLRLLYSRVGEARCPKCSETIVQQTQQEIRDSLMSLPAETKLMVLSPLVRGQRGAHEAVFSKIRKERLVRVRIDGEIHDIEQTPVLIPALPHQIEAVTDRIIIREGSELRLLEAIELATQLSGGLVTAVYRSGDSPEWQERTYNIRFACPNCDISFAELEPRTFSFNSPYGRCSVCDGLGEFEGFSLTRVWPDASKSLEDRGLRPWDGLSKAQYKKKILALQAILEEVGGEFSWSRTEFSEEQLDQLFKSNEKSKPGIEVLLDKEYATTLDDQRLDELDRFLSSSICDSCRGSRLCPEASAAVLDSRTIGELVAMELSEISDFFDRLELEPSRQTIAVPIINEIRKRLDFLLGVGVGYLSLGRACHTLSGGELQRVRLATSIGNQLTGVCYVLDEPTVGLHPQDTERLLASVLALRDAGNSVLVVEHDELFMRSADHLIDIGPEAGVRGGQIIAQGSLNEVCETDESLTGSYLTGQSKIESRPQRRPPGARGWIRLEGVSGRNLRELSAEIPLGNLVVVSGVSGSGKSTLVQETVYPLVAESLGLLAPEPLFVQSASGFENIDHVIQVTQAPVGRSARACAATYTGLMNQLRKLFAATRLSKQRGYTASRFSFNDKSGTCQECKGLGRKIVKFHFLPEAETDCDVCRGRRFNRQTLQVRFGDHNIADVLEMPVERALVEFQNVESIRRILDCMDRVGLGYLPLGQPATTLSGGEAQRIRLATELSKPNFGNTLYLLDEPTTGLHMEDIRALLDVLLALVEQGNSVLVIEHNLEVIKMADWVLDMGPGGGAAGGTLVASGTPEDIAACDESSTGQFLRNLV